MVIEIQYKEPSSTATTSKRFNGTSHRSVFAGWTGMASTAKSPATVERSGRRPREEMGVVEIDAIFGRMLGLVDGGKVA